ncbi:MAG: biotin--[acetyl-CoA-carboxylase] ligase [Ignavibacteria bacterium]|jgi:BirA family biotin operon repressor/biotin-[acetyl-CoA-carboxylase] ligase
MEKLNHKINVKYFNIEKFDIKLDTEIIGRNFIYCEEIDSTNSYLMSSKEKLQHGTILLSEFQKEGRGRRNRSWVSNKGQNLTFSILLSKSIKFKNVNVINLASSLSVAHAIENLYQLKVNLKWPNDVLIDDKKISGILLDSSSKSNKIELAVLGIGINVNQPNFSGKFDLQPTSIRKEFKKEVSRERLLSEVLNIFEENFELVKKAPQKVLSDWKSRCKLLGEKVKVVHNDNVIHGIFENISKEGYLLLNTGNKIGSIHFGDISLRT